MLYHFMSSIRKIVEIFCFMDLPTRVSLYSEKELEDTETQIWKHLFSHTPGSHCYIIPRLASIPYFPVKTPES